MLEFMLGNVRHQLDEKYRMRIPAKYREILGNPSYIVPGRMVNGEKRCLYVIPHEKFSRIIANVDTDVMYGGDEKVEDATTLLGAGDKLREDPQGRVKLDDSLCKAADIKKDIVFVGKGTYLEIWAAEIWDERYSVLNPANLNKVLDNLKKHGV